MKQSWLTSSGLSPATNVAPMLSTNIVSPIINANSSTYTTELLMAIDHDVGAETENGDVDEETEDYHNLVDRVATVLDAVNL